MSEWIRSAAYSRGDHQVKAVQCGPNMVLVMLNVGLMDANIAISLEAAEQLAEQIKASVAAARSESLKEAA
jgi:hypothetical protein